jgi:hypothetical protein
MFVVRQMDNYKLQRLVSKFKDVGRPSVTENEERHWVTEVTEYKQMTLRITYMFNGSEWASHNELISKYKDGELTEIVGTGEWI